MSKASSHHKLHGLTGWGLIIGLPFALISAVKAISGGSDGFVAWLSNPVGALGFSAFFVAAIWYCKLEFDEVIMDYFDGGLRSFGILANRLVCLLVCFIMGFAIARMAFLG